MNVKNVFHFIHTFLFFFSVPPNLFPWEDMLGLFLLRAYVVCSLPQATPLVSAASPSPDSEPAGCFTGSQSLLAWEASMAHAGPRHSEG